LRKLFKQKRINMKTNQIMIREGVVEQRTKDCYFNATLTLNNWNLQNNDNILMAKFTKLNSTKDFILQLEKEGIENPLIISTKGTWMHPKLFIDFAMWISVEFKSKVIDWVLDGLIKTRNDAGDYYNEMCATILDRYVEFNGCKPPPTIYIKEATMIKELADANIPRNEMTEAQLAKITILQKVNSTLIKDKVGKDSRIKQLTTVAKSI